MIPKKCFELVLERYEEANVNLVKKRMTTLGMQQQNERMKKVLMLRMKIENEREHKNYLTS